MRLVQHRGRADQCANMWRGGATVDGSTAATQFWTSSSKTPRITACTSRKLAPAVCAFARVVAGLHVGLAAKPPIVFVPTPARLSRRLHVVRSASPLDEPLPPVSTSACPFGFHRTGQLQPVYAAHNPARAVPALIAAAALTLAATTATITSLVPGALCLIAAAVLLLATKSIWDQYSPLLLYGGCLPPADMGKPLIGYTMERFAGGPGDEKGCFRKMRSRLGPAFTTNFGFQTLVVIDYALYEKYMLDLERRGELIPLYPDSFAKLLGANSIFVMPTGAQHTNVRRRVLAALSTKQVFRRLPEIEAYCRAALEAMADETADRGQTALVPHVDRLTLYVALAFVVGKQERDALEELMVLLPATLAGVSALPAWELFGFSPFGQALNARRQACALIDKLLEKAHRSGDNKVDNVLQALALPSADGDALTLEEIQDTVITVAMAGTITTALAIPTTVVQLANRPEWVNRCAAPLNSFDTGIEDASRPVLRFLRESMRFKVPASGFRRARASEWTSIGQHEVPPGMPITSSLESLGCPLNGLVDRSTQFDPRRWGDPAYVANNFLFWGGKQPHACAGKSVALAEMQVFIQMLCQDYDFEVLSQETAPDSFLNLNYEDGLPMRVTRRGT